MRHGKTLHSKPVVHWLSRTYIADIWQVKLSWVAHCHLRTHDVSTISSALAGANIKNVTSDDRSHTDSLLVIIDEKENDDGKDRDATVTSYRLLSLSRRQQKRQRSSEMDARCQPNGEELGLIRTIRLNRLEVMSVLPPFFTPANYFDGKPEMIPIKVPSLKWLKVPLKWLASEKKGDTVLTSVLSCDARINQFCGWMRMSLECLWKLHALFYPRHFLLRSSPDLCIIRWGGTHEAIWVSRLDS